jgi:hypothetical protein
MKPALSLRSIVMPGIISLLLSSCSGTGLSQLSVVTPLPDPAAVALTTPTAPAAQPASSPVARVSTATPVPLDLNLPAGSALAIAQATDAAFRPTPRQLLTFAESPVRLTFDEFYEGYNVRTGLILSDKLVSLDGKDVVIEGYMAPPLKAELDWFVLTRIRLAYCPFCSTAADWPDDIALIYLDGDTIRPTEKPLRLHGRLEVGPAVDPETGMVSVVRIYASKLERL